jgi:hypothetical protein
MTYRKIGFDTGSMIMRGTHIALFDYAFYNQKILGNQSIIFYDSQSKDHQLSVIDKFKKHFELIPYQNFNDLNRISEKNAIDAIYFIKSGEIDSQIIESVPNLIHAVFPQKISEKHGEVYAFVSEWLSRECSNNKIPYVPHMISMPELNDNLRGQLGIPHHAIVFGCYGGSDSFNIQFVQQSIQKVVSKSPHVYFIFMNISPFAQHERIIFLLSNSDMTYKVKFINTCDAMIHARGIGESFGLACGEFSIRNKPVITYALSPQRNHIDVLGSKAIQYKGPKELEKIFLEFDKDWSASQNWDCYSRKFSPLPVMKKFDEVFLQNGSSSADKISISIADKSAVQYYRLRKKLRSLSRKLYL